MTLRPTKKLFKYAQSRAATFCEAIGSGNESVVDNVVKPAFRYFANHRLYHAWVDDASSQRVDNNYLKLFIELESLIEKALKADVHDKHSRMRGWTPPPKGYAKKRAPDEKQDDPEWK